MEKLEVIAIDNLQTEGDFILSQVQIDVFHADPASFRGTISLYKEGEAHFTGSRVPFAKAYLEVPVDVPIIVTARKPGYLPNSVSFTPRTNQGMNEFWILSCM